LKNFLLIAGTSIFLMSCNTEHHESSASGDSADLAAARKIETIADEYLEALFVRNPSMGTEYGLEGARHDRLFDNSPSALITWQSLQDAWITELDALGPPPEIGSRDWVTYGIMYEDLTGSRNARVCRSELWQASTTTAWYNYIPSLFEIQPVDSPELERQTLDRLRSLVTYLDQEIINLRQGLNLGFSAPRLTVELVPEAVRGLLSNDSPLLSPGTRSENPEFGPRVRKLFDSELAPAIERFAGFIESEYLPQAREEISLEYNASGNACYPQLVRLFATVEPSAEEIRQLGLEQIAGIRAEMQVIIDEHFPDETIESLMKNLNINPDYTFKTREDVLNYALNSLEESKAAMTRVFGVSPKADMLIKPYPAYREDTGTGEYHSSSEDGTRPGIYYIAVKNPTNRSIAGQQSVLYHEGYPGHHLQGAIALELGDKVHPLARYLWNSGYGEGWALYSERLADELGLYDGPLDKIGMLSDQAARAARLVVDSGIHNNSWTRQQAVDYMLANTAWPPGDVEAEINRYIAWPGQATSYMLGMLEIRRLRNLAENALGEDFDIRSFHDRILGFGSITLPMLEESVLAWIAEQSRKLH
jgi:uncharacterized protein (DUF885 family)